MSYNNNNNKTQAPNKVSFSSVTLKENSKGSPMAVLYLGAEDALKMANLIGNTASENEAGVKITVQIIPGKSFDSGYCYVDAKQTKQQQQQGYGNKGGQAKGQTQNSFGAKKASAYFKSKQVTEETN